MTNQTQDEIGRELHPQASAIVIVDAQQSGAQKASKTERMDVWTSVPSVSGKPPA